MNTFISDVALERLVQENKEAAMIIDPPAPSLLAGKLAAQQLATIEEVSDTIQYE